MGESLPAHVPAARRLLTSSKGGEGPLRRFRFIDDREELLAQLLFDFVEQLFMWDEERHVWKCFTHDGIITDIMVNDIIERYIKGLR
jgi:hypothetical protein